MPDNDKPLDSNTNTDQNNQNSSVNFAPDYEETFFDQVFDWVISSGRKIIIFTEVIVLAVFLSRFWIDRQLHDIKENIENKQAIIESTQELEIEHRRIKNKLAILEEVLAQQIDWRVWLDDFTKKIPQSLVLSNLSLSKTNATLKAKATSVQSFALFVNLLISDPGVNSVILTASKYDEELKEYEFSMNIVLKSN